MSSADHTTQSLTQSIYRSIAQVSGPLLFIENTHNVAYGERVMIHMPDGSTRGGQVLEVDHDVAVVQVAGGTQGIGRINTEVEFTSDVVKIALNESMLGRVFDSLGRVIDQGPPIVAKQRSDINGMPINPMRRARPDEPILTGISAIDLMNTLVRGQKMPIFSGAGLPANELAAQIMAQAVRVNAATSDVPFAVVFAAIGMTERELSFFVDAFQTSGAIEHAALFINSAQDSAVERLIVPRSALTTAEYLAFECGYQVLVVLSDMTNYCEALREVGAARQEVPGRRGFPGYMYSDLAMLYERAGRIRGLDGSIMTLAILTMPDDDITHPIPDITGYITEGQIVLSRQMHQQGIFPPIDVLPSLSRLMPAAIGTDKTRQDHPDLANQLYALYAEGCKLRRLTAIIGQMALSDRDRQVLSLAEDFERIFVGQGGTARSLEESFDVAWEILSHLPRQELKRIHDCWIDEYHITNEMNQRGQS